MADANSIEHQWNSTDMDDNSSFASLSISDLSDMDDNSSLTSVISDLSDMDDNSSLTSVISDLSDSLSDDLSDSKSDSSDAESYDWDMSTTQGKTDALKKDLLKWAINDGIKDIHLSHLLKILKAHPDADFSKLPATATGLFQRSNHPVDMQIISNREYYSFGLKNQIVKTMAKYPQSEISLLSRIELILNIDGLPLYNSSTTNFWPILGALKLKPLIVFPVVITMGDCNPTDMEFLRPTVQELKGIAKDGVSYNGQQYAVPLKCVTCDAPAKAKVLGTKQHGAYSACPRCTVKGKWRGRVTYLDTGNEQMRTDQSFRNKSDKKYHYDMSVFEELEDVDMIHLFPYDYQHGICLGCGKKIIVIMVNIARFSKETK